MNAHALISSEIQHRLPADFTTPASQFLLPGDVQHFLVQERPRCFVNHIYQYTDCELNKLIGVAERRYTSPSKRQFYRAVADGIALEKRLRNFDTALHRQLRFLMACGNTSQNLFIAEKIRLSGHRFGEAAVKFQDCVGQLPESGLGIKDFFQNIGEFYNLLLCEREYGSYRASATTEELEMLREEIKAALKGKVSPSKRRYRERVAHEITLEITRRLMDGESANDRVLRLIHRAAMSHRTLLSRGWNIKAIFEARG